MASKSIARLLNPVFCSSRTISPSVLRPYPRLPRTSQPANRRFAHSIPKPPSPFSATGSKQSNQSEVESRKRLEPHYRLTFTCVPCGERSAHVISKQGYHKGSVLITCPTCRNRHIISDHLNIFGERKITIEDIMREKGQLVKRGTLGEDGDVEFWQDETVPGQGDDGAGDGATATSETTASQSAENEDNPEAGVEEEDATRLRETRDPSSHSTQPTGATASSLLGSSGARPKVDSTQQSNTTPSTRRPYSTKKRRYLSQPSSRRARRRKRMKYREWLHWVLRTKRYYWSHITKGPKPFSLRRTMVKVKIDDSHSVLLRPVGSFFQKLRHPLSLDRRTYRDLEPSRAPARRTEPGPAGRADPKTLLHHHHQDACRQEPPVDARVPLQ
ncbi:DNL zinc finger-domain-containing protein [Whalleya microplaca]|nr:DNL zinc finger-domain-containing protein [Whalleya microplaca]